MFVKQIDSKEALRLAAGGKEVMVMAPTVVEPKSWIDYETETLGHMLDGCLFFRREAAVINQDFEGAVQEMDSEIPPTPKCTTGDVDPSAKRRKVVDRGKVMALHKAGWSNRKIADEMKVHEATVCRVLRGLREEEKTDEEN